MGDEGLGTRVFDAGALIAVERGDERIRALLTRPQRHVIPAPVLAQVWRDPIRQVRLARFIAAAGTVVDTFDEASARAVGVVLAKSGTADIVDASVVVSARRHQAIALTSDPEDLLRIDPRLEVERV